MSEIRHAIEPEEIMAYLDGELASGRAAEAMTHLDRCPECQRLAGDLRRVSQELTAWHVEAPNQSAPVIETPKPSRRPQWRGLPAWAWAVAGAALILVFVMVPRNAARRSTTRAVLTMPTDIFDRSLPMATPAATPPPQPGTKSKRLRAAP